MINGKDEKIDVYAIGNAIVDTLAFVPDGFLESLELNRGVMTLVDADTQGRLLAAMKNLPVELHSGGSAANTVFDIRLCGGSVAFCGKVADDDNGHFYRQNMEETGIRFNGEPATSGGEPTGTCLVMTTPDAERTMCTNLGVSIALTPQDLDRETMLRAKYLYMEGYLWDGDTTRTACLEAAQLARTGGVKVSLTFSDPFCVDRFRTEFREMTRDLCDLIFCNAEEARSFSRLENLHDAAAHIGELVETAFITDGDKGALVVQKGEIKPVSGFPVRPLDTTGAGDAFAAGVLYALCRDHSPEQAARWGNYLASETVRISGSRLTSIASDRLKEILG